MYGVVTKYVLKPKASITRVASAPHLHHQRSSHESFNAFTPRNHPRPHAPDQHYGATLDERRSSEGPVIPVESRMGAAPQVDLRRTVSELPMSKHTVFAYKPQPQQSRGAGDEEKGWDGADEGTPMLGFLSAEPSNDFLPTLLTVVACLGSLCFGFHIGFSSPFEDAVLATSQLSKGQLDIMFSLISLGAVVGALTSGPFSASYGRRSAIVFSCLPYTLGSLLMVWAHHDLVFLSLGRLLIGVGVGSSSVLVPLYVAEIAPPAKRGSLGSASSFFMAAGLVLVNAAGIPAVSEPELWKVVLLAALAPIALMAVVMQLYGCETPRFLMSVQRTEDAKQALRRLRGPKWDVEGEINEMMDTEEVGLGSVAHSKEALRAWKEQYMKYFQPEASVERSVDQEDLEQDFGYQTGDEEEAGQLNAVYVKSEEIPTPPIIPTSLPTSSSATALHTVASSPTLKSSLAKPKRAISDSSAPSVSGYPPADLLTSDSFNLTEAKKSVRVTLPGHASPEPISSLSSSPSTDHSGEDGGDNGDLSNHHSNPPFLGAAKKLGVSAQNLLMRARSVARRAFPSQPVLPPSSFSPPGSPGSTVDKRSWGVYFQRSHFVPLLLGVSLQVLQQWSGINAFMFHLKAMLQDKSGGDAAPSADDGHADEQSRRAMEASAVHALYGAIGVSALQLAMGGCAMLLMERAGRRTWLLVSSLGMSIAAVLLAYACYAAAENNIKILLVMSYIASFAIGMGPMPWLVCSEIFPSAIRSSAVSIATTANWLNAFLVTASYPLLERTLTETGVYLLYAVVITGGMIYVSCCLPETGGRSLDEIEEMFDSDAQAQKG